MIADIHAAIITHYVAGAFEVATYYQGQDVTVDAGDSHARVEVAMLENASVGNGSLGYTQASGTFTVDLRYPTNTGSGAALAAADLIATHFRRGESATYNGQPVWFRGASISQPAAVDGWTSVTVTVEWTAKVDILPLLPSGFPVAEDLLNTITNIYLPESLGA